jgi:ABC-type multidrug transport system fused ATPase/permease subunit
VSVTASLHAGRLGAHWHRLVLRILTGAISVADMHGAWRKRVLIRTPESVALVCRLLRDYGARYWRRYALALVWMAIGSACISVCAYLLGAGVNQAYVDRNLPGVVLIATAAAGLASLRGFAIYFQNVIMMRIGNAITAESQRRLFDKLLMQDFGFFSDRHSSEFTARLAYGASSISSVLATVITAAGRDVLSLGGLMAVMFIKSPGLSLFGLFVMTPAVFAVRHLVRRVRQFTRRGFGHSASFIETLQETIQGLRVVRALSLEDEMRRSLHQNVADARQAADKLASLVNRSHPLMEALAGVAIGVVIVYGGYRIIFHNATPGEFVSFITAFLLAYEPAKRLTRLNIDLSNALAGVDTLQEILDLPDRITDDGKRSLTIDLGRVTFDSVDFSYRSNHPVLCGLSFRAKAGQITALVGPSGGGKSTIFNLLLRFYDAQQGVIKIDGHDVTQVSAQSLRAQIAYVGQDIFLFRGSIRRNIAFGNLDASEQDIVAAARAAYAHDFITQFPAGYDTPVGEHGLQLSGGQRQRIAVARALIRKAPIILLDEPTGSLDSESEDYVQQAIRRLAEGRTTIVIAHRLYTVTHADVIYFVENGTVVESGPHGTLLRRGGRYATYFGLQFGREAVGTSA